MSEHTKDREMTMTIDNLEDSYLREHATASDGSRWVSLKLTNETIASMQAEINQLKARNAELEQQRGELVKALKYYAENKHWYEGLECMGSMIKLREHGKVAQEALAKAGAQGEV